MFRVLLIISFILVGLFELQGEGEIYEIKSNIKIKNNIVNLKNEIHFNSLVECISLYIPTFSEKESIEVLDKSGNKVIFTIESNKYSLKININNSKNKDKLLKLNYNIDFNTLNSKKNFYSDKNQFFILPDIGYLPRQTEVLTPKFIKYILEIDNVEKNYKYIYKNIEEAYHSPPYLIMGNLIEFKSTHALHIYPKNIKVDLNKINDIDKIISDSYTYFYKTFGKPKIDLDSIKVLYLNRSGGHGLPDGLILDQNYISIHNTKINSSIIAHEVAHLWWGNSICSETTSLNEGLAEYSASLFMTDFYKYPHSKIYGEKNLEFELSENKPVNFNALIVLSDNYISFSYKKLPIIFRELELKLGQKDFTNRLKLFHLETKKSLSPIFDYNKLTKIFITNEEINEFKNDISGKIKDWPDYYVKKVNNNTVSYSADNILHHEIVPVTIISEKGDSFEDTINFSIDTTLVEKKYNTNISKIIIDKNFYLNQSITINDVFVVNQETNIYDSKYPKYYDDKYYFFADKLLSVLFYNKPYKNYFILNEKDKIIIRKAQKKLITFNIKGIGLFVNEQSKYFRIIVCFEFNNKNKQGYIDGYYVIEDNILFLKTLTRIKL